jgi:hypothetical protein
MTPKEKAIQLVNALYDGSNIKKAIALAMFVVNEIIESRKDDKHFDDRDFAKSSDYFTPHPMGLTYWKEVKNELKLNNKNNERETINNFTRSTIFSKPIL